jgi:hypothetical protein
MNTAMKSVATKRQGIPRSGVDQEQLIVDHKTVDRCHVDRKERGGEEDVEQSQFHVQLEFRQGGFQCVGKFAPFDHVPKAHEEECGEHECSDGAE